MVKEATTNEENKMKLTAKKVEDMIATAERCGFSKDSVFKAIKANKALDAKANETATEYWSR